MAFEDYSKQQGQTASAQPELGVKLSDIIDRLSNVAARLIDANDRVTSRPPTPQSPTGTANSVAASVPYASRLERIANILDTVEHETQRLRDFI